MGGTGVLGYCTPVQWSARVPQTTPSSTSFDARHATTDEQMIS